MKVFGQQLGNTTVYVGRATKTPDGAPSTLDGQVSSSIEQAGDTVTISDIDNKKDLKVGIEYTNKGASMFVSNSGIHPMGKEHAVKVSFPLPGMSQENAKTLQGVDLLNGASEVDKVSVKDYGDGGYGVEIGDGPVHNAFNIKDQVYVARASGSI